MPGNEKTAMLLDEQTPTNRSPCRRKDDHRCDGGLRITAKSTRPEQN